MTPSRMRSIPVRLACATFFTQRHAVARPCNATPSLFVDAMAGDNHTFLRGDKPTLGLTRVEASRVGWFLVLAGSFGFRNLRFLCHVCTRLLVVRLFMDGTFRIDGEHLIDRLPSVARAFPVITPPTAALQIDAELRVD